MSYLLHKSEKTIMINVTISRAAANQLEVIRRAFEEPTPEFIASLLERGIQEEFDRRLVEIGALPSQDAQPETEEAA